MSASTLSFDLSGLGLRLHRVPTDVASLLEVEWAGFVAPAPAPLVELELAESPATMAGGRLLDDRLDASFGQGTARFASEAGSVEIDAGGRGRVTLAQGPAPHRLFGLVNLLLAATGWMLSRGRGLAVHAAAAVVDDRAFLLVGASGTGKSTWAAVVREAGGLVLSDDLVLVETAPDPRALSSPFRTRPFGQKPPGHWPIAAVLFARHGADPALGPVTPLAARARLAANVLYVEADFRAAMDGDGPLPALARVPARELTFAPDPSFVPLLRSFGR